MTPLAPLLQIEWLANAQGRPVAVRLLAPDASVAARDWAALASLPELAELARLRPVCLDAGLATALANATPPGELTASALAEAGVRTLAPAELAEADLVWPTRPGANTLIAGAWFLQPPPKANAAQAASRVRALKLMQLVNADADTRDIEAELRQDAPLSYHLLRLVNGVALRGQREIGSFAQAIMILGRQQLRRWLHLMLFSARDDDPRSAMLTSRAMLRARTLELAAEALGQDRAAQERAFMAGLFSLLGVLFGQPLGEVLHPLGLAEDLLAALLRGEGELGLLLARTATAEAPLAPVPAATDTDHLTTELDPLRWAQLQLAALAWAVGSLNGEGH